MNVLGWIDGVSLDISHGIGVKLGTFGGDRLGIIEEFIFGIFLGIADGSS